MTRCPTGIIIIIIINFIPTKLLYLQVKNSNINQTYLHAKLSYIRQSAFVCSKLSNFHQNDCFPTYSFVQSFGAATEKERSPSVASVLTDARWRRSS